MLGIFYGLLSALTWGSGDFSGGVAARRASQYQVLALATPTGLLALGLAAVLVGEGLPGWRDAVFSAAAGIGGALGMLMLYRGLALGNAAIVAPASSVITAGISILAAAMLEGLPSAGQAVGLVLGLAGIWLLTSAAPKSTRQARQGLGLALLAGVGFGSFFVCIAQVGEGDVFAPLVVAKISGSLMALWLLTRVRHPFPKLRANPLAILAGLLDSGGNIFYLMATRTTRLDVAAVLSSMYPAFTVLLSMLLLKEQINRPQWVGVSLCLAATALMVV